ncbi:TPA: hypothetical protein HA246_07195 [Candidatus Woesearchaeota archaeon]|nr:hypothetical protein [Candidatus Woesearchaeota archaeon]
MGKSPELEKRLQEDAELKFFDSLGNTLFLAETYAVLYGTKHREDNLLAIKRAKDEFYRRLEEFQSSGYNPKGKLNLEALKKFDEFKTLDWSVDANIEKVKEYMATLRPED